MLLCTGGRMSLNQKLQACRTEARLTQQQVADVLHVPRESISMWEKGNRVPGLRQIEDLARLYSVSVDFLLGNEEKGGKVDEREILCRGLINNPAVHLELSKWFDFLDEWGDCILVNVQNSPGRQSFTLAHEFAHALFHYNSRSLISIRKDSSPREYFADAFASHFLVPTKEMNKLIENWGWRNHLDPHKAIELAYVFRVSYVFMLNRLRNERHITEEQRQEWSTLSPAALAQQLGLDASVFHKPGTQALNLHRYPASVLQTIRDLINRGELYVSQAADLLDVSQAQIQSLLLSEPARATESEQKEACEFAF